ncbi:aspartate/glutamate racemase family protein [Falsiroseomonas sp. HW251]|uniref:aspartate/glutamate racemase family protein n=1 Tax=Falsiroseomonas sp. HW251 TaxID=3390998 RepID=UPI003D314552
MHVGLIVGIGPAAADYYYRRILDAVGERGAALDLTMAHADIRTLLRNLAADDKPAQAAIYRRLTDRLARAGAEAVAVTSIGGSFCIDAFKPVSPLPVIDLLEEVERGVAAAGYRRVGVIGTNVAMRTRLYGAVRSAALLVPEGEMLDRVHDAYTAMALAGAATEVQRSTFFEAGHHLMARGAEAVMLGGTDLALAFTGDPPFPLFDCAGVHAAAIARAALP